MQFPTTRWDELAQASLHGDLAAREVLNQFCRRYWDPVNAFVRWKGYSEADAADLTQDFFLNFLETRSWRRAHPLRGNFRTFLLGALTHRLQKAHARGTRLKRGGGAEVTSLDEFDNDEDLPQVPPTDSAYFDRAWARPWRRLQSSDTAAPANSRRNCDDTSRVIQSWRVRPVGWRNSGAGSDGNRRWRRRLEPAW